MIDRLIFGVSISKEGRGYDSKITFGDIDEDYAKKDSLDWLNIDDFYLPYWNVNLHDLELGDSSIRQGAQQVAFTLADPFLHFPESSATQAKVEQKSIKRCCAC